MSWLSEILEVPLVWSEPRRCAEAGTEVGQKTEPVPAHLRELQEARRFWHIGLEPRRDAKWFIDEEVRLAAMAADLGLRLRHGGGALGKRGRC